MEVDPQDPYIQPATYKLGLFESNIVIEGSSMPLKIEMKKNEAGEIVFDYNGVISGSGESGDTTSLKFNLNGIK